MAGSSESQDGDLLHGGDDGGCFLVREELQKGSYWTTTGGRPIVAPAQAFDRAFHVRWYSASGTGRCGSTLFLLHRRQDRA